MEQSLPNGRAFVNRILLYTAGYVTAACVVISLYLSGLLQLSSIQWRHFFQITTGVLILIFPAMIATHWRVFQRIQTCLDLDPDDASAEPERRAGFATIADFPRYWYVWGLGWWAIGGGAVGLVLWLLHPEVGLFPPAIIFTATVSAALITDTYYYLTVKRLLRPARTRLAAELADPGAREELTRGVSLRTKLLTAIASVTLVTVTFAAFLAQVSTERAIAAFARGASQRTLSSITSGGSLHADASAARLAFQDGSHYALLVSRDRTQVLGGAREALSAHDLEWILEQEAASGDSAPLGRGRSFAWQRLPSDGGVLVVGVPPAQLVVESDSRAAFAGLLIFSSLVAIGVAWLLARDIGEATERLSREAARITAGDLTPAEPFESEDEMGELGRSFERMSSALRATVVRVSGTADRMQSAAAEISAASRDVARANESQVQGIDQASGSMAAIDQQVVGITRSAASLSEDVDSASSAILELGSAGSELEGNAEALSSNVEEVTSSIEEMASSIDQVANNSDEVAVAAEEASSSIHQTSAAVQQADSNASSMSILSDRVVELSEQGRVRMRETVESIGSIREATDRAQQVIGNLATSAGRIDSVISVIDAVADETKLLALNAAIIAAQAGEQGRPFAVVAEQVKELASRVRSSTSEVTELIRNLQFESSDASRAIEHGSEMVQRGVTLSREADASLDQITQAARESGLRVSEIVTAMGEQTKAVTFVAQQILRVRGGTEQIRGALQEQGQNTSLLRQSSSEMADVSKQVQATTQEHAQSTASINRSMQGVRDSVGLINAALQEQSEACRQALEFMRDVSQSTHSNEDTVQRLDRSMRSLEEKAEELHAEVDRFRI